MKKTITIMQILTAIILGVFSIHVANTWNIPVDNQMAMALFGCFFFTIAGFLILIELKDLFKKIWS